jgi:AcrR family transcriptional regulator
MGIKERREREKSEVREKILDVARQLFIAEGYDGVSMRKVAEQIEYSPTAIYLHFADKKELFRELCHEDFGRLAALFQGAQIAADPIERMKQIGRLYVEFGIEYPNHYKLMFMTPHPANFDPEDVHDREVKGNPEMDAYAFLKQTVQAAIDAARFRPDCTDAELISQTMWAAVHGVIALHIAKGHDGWVEWRPIATRVELMLDAVMNGMLRGES